MDLLMEKLLLSLTGPADGETTIVSDSTVVIAPEEEDAVDGTVIGEETVELENVSDAALTEIDQLTDLLASLLNVENASETISQTQKVLTVEDDTDLEDSARFDLLGFFEEKGLNAVTSKFEGKGVPPRFILETMMQEEAISVPRSNTGISVDGKIIIDFPEKIENMEPESLVELFNPEGTKDAKRRRVL